MTLAMAGPASAAPGAEQFCADNGDFGISHGQCVSQAEANNGNADAVAFCRILELDFGPFPLGRCVSHFQQNGLP